MTDWWDSLWDGGWHGSWGAAAFTEDLAAAVNQAHDWAATTAAAKNWPAADLYYLSEMIDFEGSISSDPAAFWPGLALQAEDYPPDPAPDGWSDLVGVFRAGGTAAATTSEGRSDAQLDTMAAATVRETWSELTSPQATALALAGLAMFVGVLSWTRR